MDPDSERFRSQHARQIARFRHYAILFLSLLVNITAIISIPTTPEPYHTSILSGAEWVMELLAGHPERIRCELGVHRHVFSALIDDLRSRGHTDSRLVSLEEQLAIFLYTMVTGLPVRHVGERFQRANETIAK